MTRGGKGHHYDGVIKLAKACRRMKDTILRRTDGIMPLVIPTLCNNLYLKNFLMSRLSAGKRQMIT